MRLKTSIICMVILSMIVCSSCSTSKYSQSIEKANQNFSQYLNKENIKQARNESGLVVVTLREGEGETPKLNKRVAIQYIGKTLDGIIFDSTYDKQSVFLFTTGNNEVIKGLEEGVLSMKKGEKALLVIPFYLAYGSREIKGIPPYSPLIFEVELIDYEK